MSKLSLEVQNAYRPLYQNHINNYRYIVYYGGRGGGKSWAVAQALLTLGIAKKTRILCAREVQTSIQDSVHKLLKDMIYHEKAYSKFYYITKTSIVGKNGSEFIFKGIAHDPMQIKSLEGVDICWVEEAQKVSLESWEILIPTIRKENSFFMITFNPDQLSDPTYQRFIEKPPPNSLVTKINYYDNPYFPSELKDEMEYLKSVDYDLYLHIWEGFVKTITNSQIFKNKFEIKEFDIKDFITEDKHIQPLYGLDWGFANDPTAIIRCFIDENCLYIDYEAGGVGIELDYTKEYINKIPNAKNSIIRADLARPESISFVKRQGYNIVPAPKWSNSVEEGIKFIQTFKKVFIHPRCKETINEFSLYSYKTDKITGDILPIIIDKHNHYIDALRYALSPYIKNSISKNYTSQKQSFIKSKKYSSF